MGLSVIEIDEQVAAVLRAQAEARQLPLSDFLQHIVGTGAPASLAGPMTEEEWNSMFDEVAADASAVPSVHSREDIYSDHD